MSNANQVFIAVEELGSAPARESAMARVYDTILGATQRGEPFEVGVLAPFSSTPVWILEGTPITDRQSGADEMLLVETYFPGQKEGRDNTWMYAEMRPGTAGVSRTYRIDEERKPGRTAGWTFSRMQSLLDALSQRYPEQMPAARDQER